MADIRHIKDLAKKLNLQNIAKGKVSLDVGSMKPLDFLEDVLINEIECRRIARIKRLKKQSRLPKKKFKREKLDKGLLWQIDNIEKLEFIKNFNNIIITGDCNKGKTSLISEIGDMALDNGYGVVYHTLTTYLDVIKYYYNGRQMPSEYKVIKSSDIVIIDDFLYSKISDLDLELLYKSIISLNDVTSFIFISNRKISEFVAANSDIHLMKTFIERIKKNSHIINL